MDAAATARQVLEACGGKANVRANAICMTRLRLDLVDPSRVDGERLGSLHGVLGIRSRGEHGVEVVFGPAVIDAIAQDFCELTGRPLGRKTAKAITRLAPAARPSEPLREGSVRDPNPARRASYAAQRRANRTLHQGTGADVSPAEAADDLDQLRRMLEGPDSLLEAADAAKNRAAALMESDDGMRLLVINGPNLNMLGIREPDVYGSDTYASLVELCRREGARQGFCEVRCFQSNHEGAIVDEVQAALGRFDAIVMNPAAYTHTSVAILDALKAVSLPCVEVHISDVDSREDFRQVSYVRAACIATVSGEGLDGYAHAIRILADHLCA